MSTCPSAYTGGRFFVSMAHRFGKCEKVDEETKLGTRFDVGRFRDVTSCSGPIDHTVNLFIGDDVFLITVLEERFGDLDRGMALPPHHSTPGYYLGSDECNSDDGDGVSYGGSGDGCGGRLCGW